MDRRSAALLELGRELRRAGYEFVTVTPETHRRLDARWTRAGQTHARDLRGVFGYSRSFEAGLLPPAWLDLLRAAGALAPDSDGFRSRVRFSSLGGELYAHSAYPTQKADAVFFGPDTYRFCASLRRWAPRAPRGRRGLRRRSGSAIASR